MDVCLALNGVEIDWPGTSVGDRIIALARGGLDAPDLADWLRARCG